MSKGKLFGVLVATVVFVCLLALQTVLVEQWKAIHEERERHARIKQEILRLERLVTDVDNGFRGYVLMKQSVFLGPMIAAEGKIPGVIDGLNRLTEEAPDLQRGVLILNNRVNELLDVKRRLTLDLERGQEDDVLAYIRGGEGLALASTIGLAFQDLHQKLDGRQRDREGKTAQKIEWVQWGLTATVLGGCVFGIGLGRATSRSDMMAARTGKTAGAHDRLERSQAAGRGGAV